MNAEEGEKRQDSVVSVVEISLLKRIYQRNCTGLFMAQILKIIFVGALKDFADVI